MKKTKKIALSGISTAFATIFLVLGNYIPLLDYSFYFFSSLCITLPFATKEIRWGILTFIVSAILGFIFVPNILVMFSFLVFFGPYAIIASILRLKKVKYIIQYIIKSVFFVLSIFLMYKFTSIFLEIGQIGSISLSIWILLVAAFVVMCVYDYLMLRIIRQLERTILQILS